MYIEVDAIGYYPMI